MKLRTEIILDKSPDLELNHPDQILLLGSCFTQNIGSRLTEFKFQTKINPLGISYNPISICDQLIRIINEDYYAENDLFLHQGKWKSHDLHSSFTHSDKSALIHLINKEIMEAHQFIKACKLLVISMGTAYVFEHKDEKRIYNNCHKLENHLFLKKKLQSDEIQQAFAQLRKHLEKINPGLKIIMTVSPIRHQKDGMINNSFSKSTLIQAVNQMMESDPNALYFPSYEIMLDDLRDYRFYKDDLLHPSEIAIDYIWEKFSKSFFSQNCLELCDQIKSINQALRHRPLNPESEENVKFQKNLESKLKDLQKRNPHINY